MILHGFSWAMYADLLLERGDSPGRRIAFHQGTVEVVRVSAGREYPNCTLGEMVAIACEETRVDYCPLGSTTFLREDLQAGFEPDSCFYFTHAEAIRNKDEIDLAVDPPPELVIDVDVPLGSFDKLAVFAAAGVREVWRFRDGNVSVFALGLGGYSSVPRSAVLPVLTADAITRFLEESRCMRRLEWIRCLRGWIQARTAN